MDFSAVIQEQLAGKTVRYADLMRFDFAGGEMRLFQGRGRLRCGNGEEWLGIGRLGRISSVTSGPGGGAEEMTLELSGDARINQYFKQDDLAAAGREATRYVQFFEVRQFDDAGLWVEWQPLGVPVEMFSGVMSPLQSDVEPAEATAGNSPRVLTLKVVNLFYNRKKAAHGYWSQRDQQARAPGDNIFQETSRMASATVRWPAQLT